MLGLAALRQQKTGNWVNRDYNRATFASPPPVARQDSPIHLKERACLPIVHEIIAVPKG